MGSRFVNGRGVVMKIRFRARVFGPTGFWDVGFKVRAMASKLCLAAALVLGGAEGRPGDCVKPPRTQSIFKLAPALPFNQCGSLCAANGLVMPCLADVEEDYQYVEYLDYYGDGAAWIGYAYNYSKEPEFAWLDGCASKMEARWATDDDPAGDCTLIDGSGVVTGNSAARRRGRRRVPG
jgi:hypothetical protein